MTLKRLGDLNRWKTKAMTTMLRVLTIIKIRMNPLRSWHVVDMTYTIPVAEERLRYRLSGTFVTIIVRKNRLTWLGLRPSLNMRSLPCLDRSSSWISRPRQKRLAWLIPMNMIQKLLGWMTWLPNQHFYSEILRKRWHMLRLLSLL